jgi:hypothetical protein
MLRLAQGVADRQVDQAQLACAIAMRQAARVREAERLASTFVGGPPQGVLPVAPVKPQAFVGGQGVWNLRIGECPDSSVWFAFDDDPEWFTLGPRLAGLLMFLVPLQASDCYADEVVPFRTRPEILEHLRETGGREYDPKYVNNLVNKLRDSLRVHDKRILIVTHRQKGARFLVRRGGIQYMQLDHIPVRQRVAGTRPPPSSG